MKLTIFFLLVMTISVSAHAEPFLTCDPQQGVTKYQVTLEGVTSISDATPEGAAWHDLATVTPGIHNGEIKAGIVWEIDGVPQEETYEWSPPTPFVLKRPVTGQAPVKLKLRK